MRQLALIFLFLLITFSLFSQHKKIDSLIIALKSSQQSNYREIFYRLEGELSKMDPDSALRKADEINLATARLNFLGPQSSAYRCSAIAFERNDNIPMAIEVIEKAMQLAKEYNLSIEEADNLRVLGNIYRYSGRFKLALKNYFLALRIYDGSKKYTREKYLLYSYIGDIYYKAKHYKLSKDYLSQTYKYGKNLLEPRIIINALNTIALIHRNKQEYGQANYYQLLSLRLAQNVHDSAWIGIANGNLGRIFQLQHKYDQAIHHYKIDILLSERFKEWGDVIITMSRLAEINIERKQFGQAKMYLDSSALIASREHEYDSKLFLYGALTKYYRELKQIDQAFKYQTLYTQVKDSLEKKSYIEEIDQMRTSFELEKKQNQIELLKKKNQVITASEERKNFVIFLAALLLAFIGVISFVLYRNNVEKTKSNDLLLVNQQELSEKNEEIHKKNEEIIKLNNSLEKMVEERTKQLKDTMEDLIKQNQNLEQFSYVISHNLRSPIAQILGLISIFNKENAQDPSNLSVLELLNKAGQNLDDVVNDLNVILLMKNHSHQNKETIQINDVVQSNLRSLSNQVEEAKATVEMDLEDCKSIVTNKAYFNSIMYNLISNAIKYRSSHRPCLIKISSKNDGKYIRIKVEDNGLGMDLTKVGEDKIFRLYQRMHFHTEGKGMGLFIVKEQVEALKGKIELESQVEVGTTFTLTFPV